MTDLDKEQIQTIRLPNGKGNSFIGLFKYL